MAEKTDQTLKKKKFPFNIDSWHETTAAFENDLYRKNQVKGPAATPGPFHHVDWVDGLRQPGLPDCLILVDPLLGNGNGIVAVDLNGWQHR